MTVPIGTSVISANSLVPETLDIGQQHGDAEGVRQRLDRRLDIGVGEPVHRPVLGTPTDPVARVAGEPAVQVEVLHVLDVGISGRRFLARYLLMYVFVRIR